MEKKTRSPAKYLRREIGLERFSFPPQSRIWTRVRYVCVHICVCT
jgi:hypothetical protein